MATEIFLDSGAVTVHQKLSKLRTLSKGSYKLLPGVRQRRRNDHAYFDSPEYRKYRRDYAAFVKQHHSILSTACNLDVMHNAELTYKNQKWFEAHNVPVIPVWHLGCDEKFLQAYVEEGYDYICIGGMVGNRASKLRMALDRIWTEILTDKAGMPRVKIHGFAMTSFKLMHRYPWYSVDSKSWLDYARYGMIIMPSLRADGQFDWLNPARLFVSAGRRKDRPHIDFVAPLEKRTVLRFLKEIDIPLGKSKLTRKPPGSSYEPDKDGQERWAVKPTRTRAGIVEEVVEAGIINKYILRMSVTAFVMQQIEKRCPEWPWSIFSTVGRPERRRSLL